MPYVSAFFKKCNKMCCTHLSSLAKKDCYWLTITANIGKTFLVCTGYYLLLEHLTGRIFIHSLMIQINGLSLGFAVPPLGGRKEKPFPNFSKMGRPIVAHLISHDWT